MGDFIHIHQQLQKQALEIAILWLFCTKIEALFHHLHISNQKFGIFYKLRWVVLVILAQYVVFLPTIRGVIPSKRIENTCNE